MSEHPVRRSKRSTQTRAQRLFVAAYPPPDLVAEMATVARTYANDDDVRFTPHEQVHLTLHFIGDTSAGEIENAIESVSRSCKGIESFSLLPTRVITLPRKPRATPRLIAIETDAPASLREVQRRLAHRFARRPRRDSGDRFLPHLTLCRFRPGVRATPIETIITHLPSFEVMTVKLVRSRLRPSGAIHEDVATIPLAAS